MNDDGEKAIQEAAKIAAETTVKEATRFIEMVVGEPMKGLGGILSDRVNLWRYKNLLKQRDIVASIHTKRKLEGKSIPIPPRYAVPFINAASMEDDDTIQNLWAGLIANATDPNQRLSLRKVYRRMLSEMEPLDAQVLDLLMRDYDFKTNITREEAQGVTVSELSAAAGCSQNEIQMSILNLYQMQCIFDHSEMTWNELNSKSIFTSTQKPDARFQISPLGISLLEACKH